MCFLFRAAVNEIIWQKSVRTMIIIFLMRERRFVSKNLLLQAACVEIYAKQTAPPAHTLIPWLYLVKLKYVNYFWAESRSKILLEATVKAVLYVLCMCIALLTSPPNHQ